MQLRLLLLVLTSWWIQIGGAQTLSGKITDIQNTPIPGVTIKVLMANIGTQSNVSGNYSIKLNPSQTYQVEFSAIGYQSKMVSDIKTQQGGFEDLNIVLEHQAASLENVVVTAKKSSARLETVSSIIAFQKNTNTVASVISAESIKRSPDRNTGEVLKRIPGASIIDGKYLVIRGLADRYNQAMINGVLMGSTEADRKTFSFDILPSGIIDNIIINKAFVPELPGEWAGGMIQVNTKDVPSQPFLQIQVGTGFNSQTIGRDFYKYRGGKTDWLGFDDGTRALPAGFPTKTAFESLSIAEKAAWGAKMENNWVAEAKKPLLNQSVQMNGGFNSQLGKNNKLGAILGINYNRSNRRIQYENKIMRFQNDVPDIYSAYDNNKYSEDVLAGAIANFALQLGANHKIAFKNLLNVNTSNYSLLRTGTDFEGLSANPDQIKATELAYKGNTFFNTQLTGDHNLVAIKSRLHWFGSFNILDQYIPDQRRIFYTQDQPGDPFLNIIPISNASQKNGSRFYSFLNDYNYTLGVDLSKPFLWNGKTQTLKGGYFFQVKDRLFDARPFTNYNPGGSAQYGQYPQDKIFAPENFGTGKLAFNELGPGQNYRYLANSILNAGFLQLDNQIGSLVRMVWGLRIENFDQVIGSMRQSDPRHVHTAVTDFLPGLNLTLKTDSKTNFRISGSQTVVRPEFRELSKFQFYDFEMGAIIAGNTALKRTKVTNADLRYEYYPAPGETFNIGGFYKYFDKPLEAYFNPASGDGSTFNLLNAAGAQSLGAELEFRKKINLFNDLDPFILQGNFSYIYNQVKDTTSKIDRPMQGQSPYLINLALQYDWTSMGLNATVLFNQIGRRIIFVGGSDQPPIWENPRPLLDFQIAKKMLNNRAEIKLNISDILNRAAIFYYDVDQNKKFHTSKDAAAIQRKYGTNFSCSFGYTF